MNKIKVKSLLVNWFPSLLIGKAWLVALIHRWQKLRGSYSQAGEDVVLDALLAGLDCRSLFYVDVGANHPTRLSNTYRLYRRGASGLVIEPNRALLAMHRFVRPRDVQMGVGCGAAVAVLPFRHATSHVLSGFDSQGRKTDDIRASELLPVLPLDLILASLSVREIAVMSVDVEGFDFEVLRGASESLKKTQILVVEGSREDQRLAALMDSLGFELNHETLHNLVFVNRCFRK